MKIKTNHTTFALGMIALLLAAACAAPGGGSLDGTSWVLVDFNGQTEFLSEVTLGFADGTAKGNSGCNSFSGGYSIEGSSLSIAEMASTLMACDQPVMDFESEFLATLGSNGSYEVSGSTLTIQFDGGSMTFEAVQ